MKIGNLDGIADLRGKLPGKEDYAWRELADIRYLVVHHSGVDADNAAREVAAYHTRVMGWPGIGYHFIVHQGGATEYVGDILQVRYNVAGRNRETVGICLAGNFEDEPPAVAQLESARMLLANLQYALGWFVPVVGHREIALPGFGTACPGKTFLAGPTWKEVVR